MLVAAEQDSVKGDSIKGDSVREVSVRAASVRAVLEALARVASMKGASNKEDKEVSKLATLVCYRFEIRKCVNRCPGDQG